MDMYRNDLDGFKKVADIGIVDLVVGFMQVGHSFSVRTKHSGDRLDVEAVDEELRNPSPIIGYGGSSTIPFISDPSRSFPGAFAVLDSKFGAGKALLYGPNACPLDVMRDRYRYHSPIHAYFVLGGALDVVRAFLERGYVIYESPDLKDFDTRFSFMVGREIALDEIVAASVTSSCSP